MNILISHSWLSEFLKTKASPKEIQKSLSLCGQSVESVAFSGEDYIYNIEITGNRPDAMSVAGVARELTAILPQFKIESQFVNDPYKIETESFTKEYGKEGQKKLQIKTDPSLNPRFTAIVVDNVNIADSPEWLKKRLIQSGMRPINNVVDITNYIMKTYGQPVHAFDFSEIKADKNGLPTMILRPSKKGEKITTLDGKEHLLPGGDIVIEDGSGRLIDLCGIMGGSVSHVFQKSKSIVLFLQTYNAKNIRRTAMSLGHHTEAAALFEKNLDPELVLPCMKAAIDLILALTKGAVASRLYDIYPRPYKVRQVSVSLKKLELYLGVKLKETEIQKILESLGLPAKISSALITAKIPSFRQDIEIGEDLIEEVARIYGYHNLPSRIAIGSPIQKGGDPNIIWIEKTKDILKYLGFTEVYTLSFVSSETLKNSGFDPQKCIKLKNPLTKEGEYLRPSLLPGIINAVKENSHRTEDTVRLFELSKTYTLNKDKKNQSVNTPLYESLSLTGAVNGTDDKSFFKLKGIIEELLYELGISIFSFHLEIDKHYPFLKLLHPRRRLGIQVDGQFCGFFGQAEEILLFDINFEQILKNVKSHKTYQPVLQYPPIIEDMTFVFPQKTYLGPIISTLKESHELLSRVKLIASYKESKTFRLYFQDKNGNLTSSETAKIKEKIAVLLKNKFSGKEK